jgi:hypothetical protein
VDKAYNFTLLLLGRHKGSDGSLIPFDLIHIITIYKLSPKHGRTVSRIQKNAGADAFFLNGAVEGVQERWYDK